jgi:HAE1 family hydrophobic/amphiphilic exporter-1
MIASSTISIFIVPVLFVLFTRFSYGKKQLKWLQEHHEELMEKARRVEESNIDPELEYDIAEARAYNEADRASKGLSKQGEA